MMCSMLNSSCGIVCHSTGFYYKVITEDIPHCTNCGLTYCAVHAEDHKCQGLSGPGQVWPKRRVCDPGLPSSGKAGRAYGCKLS